MVRHYGVGPGGLPKGGVSKGPPAAQKSPYVAAALAALLAGNPLETGQLAASAAVPPLEAGAPGRFAPPSGLRTPPAQFFDVGADYPGLPTSELLGRVSPAEQAAQSALREAEEAEAALEAARAALSAKASRSLGYFLSNLHLVTARLEPCC